MPSARTEPVDLSAAPYPGPPNPLIRAGRRQRAAAVRHPAVRRRTHRPRLAVADLLDRRGHEVALQPRGAVDRSSTARRATSVVLLQNSFRWLAAPSLQSEALGGYVTPADRLTPTEPPARGDHELSGDAPRVRTIPPCSSRRPTPTLFKGLIGAQTSLSGGSGTVAEYAAAAKQAGLDFLVFLEDFARLDAAELEQLKADCRQYSDDRADALPGLPTRQQHRQPHVPVRRRRGHAAGPAC